MIGLLLAAARQSVGAQEPPGQHRIAIVIPAGAVPIISESSSDPLGRRFYQSFFEELRRLGDVEGQNLVIERYSGEGRPEGFADLAREVIGRNPDVIVAQTDPVALAVRAATGAIPIVWVGVNAVELGLVTNLARPGGNITGVSLYDAEIYAKRLQILKEAAPSASKVVFLTPRRASQRPDAIMVSDIGDLFPYRQLIVELIDKSRLPAIYGNREYVEAGGLMAYGVDTGEAGRRIADDVHEILNGTKPGDIPVYKSTKFEFVINLQAAEAIGLTIPPPILARADEVIE